MAEETSTVDARNSSGAVSDLAVSAPSGADLAGFEENCAETFQPLGQVVMAVIAPIIARRSFQVVQGGLDDAKSTTLQAPTAPRARAQKPCA